MPRSREAAEHRQAIIRDLLGTQRVRSQSELIALLEDRGVQATQSCVSRDLRELHVAKVDGRYVLGSSLVGARVPRELTAAAGTMLDATPAGANLLVLHTPPGRASVLALTIDAAGWPEVLGTIAGDDTVFLATGSTRDQSRVLARLGALAKEHIS